MRQYRKSLALFLVLAMLLSLLPVGVFAVPAGSEPEPYARMDATEDPAQDAPMVIDNSANVGSGLGEFKLTIHHTIPDTNSDFKAELTPSGGGASISVTVTPEEKNKTLSSGMVYGLASDTYSLTVTGKDYVPYRQEININDDRIEISLYNDDMVNQGKEKGETLLGVITLGDFNGDEKIDDEDANIVKGAIGTTGLSDFDMNGDSKVDVTDLAYVVRNQSGNVDATPQSTASLQKLKKLAETNVTKGTPKLNSSGTSEAPQNIAEAIFSDSTDTFVSFAPAQEGIISENNPVEIDLNLAANPGTPEADAKQIEAEAITIAPPEKSENAITDGSLLVEGTVNGVPQTFEAPLKSTHQASTVSLADVNRGTQLLAADGWVAGGSDDSGTVAYVAEASPTDPTGVKDVSVESDGTIVINIGQKVAIKKISIKVTETSGGSLAEIASVQFLGNFAARVPEPDLSIPTINGASNTQGEDKELTFSWTPQTNVTGYEISIRGPGLSVQRSVTAGETKYTFQSDSFNGRVAAYETYNLMVRSVSGGWRSAWSDAYPHTIDCTQTPPKPEYVTATPGVMSLNVSWRALYDTQSWAVFYRLKGSGTDYQKITELKTPSCTIPNLEGGKEYELYVVAHNTNGDSPASAPVTATALTASGVDLPKYGLINHDSDYHVSMEGIQEIKGGKPDKAYTIYKGQGVVVDFPHATTKDWEVIADNKPDTYVLIDDWDSGVYYDFSFRGPSITLKTPHKIGAIRIAPSETSSVNINQIKIGYKSDDTGAITIVNTSFSIKYDDLGRRFYEAVLEKPITTDYFEVYTTVTYSAKPMTITELGIYEYDSLTDEVNDLFTDSTQLVLKPTVTAQTITDLRTRVNTPDESKECTPRQEVLLKLLDYADKLLADGVMDDPIELDTNVSITQDGHLGFAQKLSDNQPLGYVAAAGDTLIVYVSSTAEARDANASLQFTVTQYHPEVNSWSRDILHLKVGRNEIQLPALTSATKERGGSVYIWYGSHPNAKNYTIRVKGATKIPMLNVDGLTEEERNAAIDKYVTELEAYVPTIESLHNQLHLNNANKNVDYAYNEKECFLNSTEIVMKYIFYSVPASQVLAGISSKGTSHAQRVACLKESIEAMEQEVRFFYQFKGLNETLPSSDTDRYPHTRLNIRYHQMFTGAFMYAGGKHIGIEWGSVPGLFGISPVQTDANGKRISGGYSGWGIAHEIGHCINASAYQRVEVTNNVFAQIGKMAESPAENNEAFRTTYDKVYTAVAAGNTGHTGDLAVQLAMYWQLHLAYDDNYSFKFYDGETGVKDQQDNLFYARVDSYFRNASKADEAVKAATGKELKINLTANADQNFMRVCCAAALKDVLDFFRAWGFTPDADTIAYASNFTKETRDIQFIDDDSHLYRIENGPGMSAGTKVDAKITNAVNSRITTSNEVHIQLSNTNQNANAMLGYAIYRNGTLTAFVPATPPKEETAAGNGGKVLPVSGTGLEYVDVISTENNKAFVYKVVGIDRLLNKTAEVVLPEVKVQHDGAISKSGWTAESNLTGTEDVLVKADMNNGYCEDTWITTLDRTFDGSTSTVYTGSIRTDKDGKAVGKDAEIILNLGGIQQIAAFRYTPGGAHPIGKYTISVSTDCETWEIVKSDTFSGSSPQTVYFNKQLADGAMDPWMYVYDASFVKITATGQSTISVAEFDILGPTNDNIELITGGFGKLSTNFKYSSGKEDYIPAGSLVFYGEYQGDPSYSVVLLKDQNGKIINGDQIIMAEVTSEGYLGSTSDGRWFYWIPEGKLPDGVTSVQAELYRVMNAFTNEGERLTSTTLHFTIPSPSNIPNVQIASDANAASNLHAFRAEPAAIQAAAAVSLPESAVAPVMISTAEMPRFASAPSAVPMETDMVISAGEPAAPETSEPQTAAELPVGAVSHPLVLTPDNINKNVKFELYASEQPVAMQATIHVSSNAAEKYTPQGHIDWDKYNEKDLYVADTYDEDGNINIYVVSRSGFLGSEATDRTHTLVLSGTLQANEVQGTDLTYLRFTSENVQYVSPIYKHYAHDAVLDSTLNFIRETTPEPGSDPEHTGNMCEVTFRYLPDETATEGYPSGQVIRTKEVASGSTMSQLEAPPEPHGYRFEKWIIGTQNEDGTVTITNEEFTANTVIESDLTVYATFKAIPKVKVTFKVDQETWATQDVLPGDVLETMPDTPPAPAGYLFAGWVMDNGTLFTKDTPVSSTMTLTARFEKDPNPHVIVTLIDSITNETFGSLSVKTGEEVTLPDPPTHSGYSFTGWFLEDGTQVQSPLKATAEMIIYARYSQSSSGSSRPSGSGSSSGTTVLNPDGSRTTTEKKPDGTTVETTTYKDGTKIVTETARDGSSTTEGTAPNGVTATSHANQKGQMTDAAIHIPAEAVVENKTVTAPIVVSAGTDAKSAPVISVKSEAKGVTHLEIPVQKPEIKGTVAVRINPDGTEEIIRESYVSETGVVFPVEGNENVKIIDNHKEFNDVKNQAAWASDAVDFVSSRELFIGTAEHVFSPNTDMSRGMLVTVLYRLAYTPDAPAAAFPDVNDNSWFTPAVNWAAENGVVNGYPDGSFAPDESITREQMVTILYRYAVSKGYAVSARDSLAGFADAGQVSGYAKEAMQWAVGCGLVNGMDATHLAPTANTRRSEVAAILMRFCESVVR